MLVGDHQDILGDMSTFAAHISRLAKLSHRLASTRSLQQLGGAGVGEERGGGQGGELERSHDGSHAHHLVLLDEICSGTDPVEGAALGQALLENLVAPSRPRIRLAASTHYPVGSGSFSLPTEWRVPALLPAPS